MSPILRHSESGLLEMMIFIINQTQASLAKDAESSQTNKKLNLPSRVLLAPLLKLLFLLKMYALFKLLVFLTYVLPIDTF